MSRWYRIKCLKKNFRGWFIVPGLHGYARQEGVGKVAIYCAGYAAVVDKSEAKEYFSIYSDLDVKDQEGIEKLFRKNLPAEGLLAGLVGTI
jgi:hypothetical protein